LKIEILEKSTESYTPRLSPAVAYNTMVIVVVEICEELVSFGNYGFQKQIQGNTFSLVASPEKGGLFGVALFTHVVKLPETVTG